MSARRESRDVITAGPLTEPRETARRDDSTRRTRPLSPCALTASRPPVCKHFLPTTSDGPARALPRLCPHTLRFPEGTSVPEPSLTQQAKPKLTHNDTYIYPTDAKGWQSFHARSVQSGSTLDPEECPCFPPATVTAQAGGTPSSTQAPLCLQPHALGGRQGLSSKDCKSSTMKMGAQLSLGLLQKYNNIRWYGKRPRKDT